MLSPSPKKKEEGEQPFASFIIQTSVQKGAATAREKGKQEKSHTHCHTHTHAYADILTAFAINFR